MRLHAENSATPPSPFARLQRLARPRQADERCELCGARIPSQHQHVLEVASRRLLCACEACSILFSDGGSPRHRRVPRRILKLDGFQIDEPLWQSLSIPINLAFFFRSSATGAIAALYPSPAGATESAPALEAWAQLAAANPALDAMQPDVEALLVNCVGKHRLAFIAPIDQCYRLVGVIRTHWRGLSGGVDVWREIERFFDALAAASVSSGGQPNA